jgi:hypothetical protein
VRVVSELVMAINLARPAATVILCRPKQTVTATVGYNYEILMVRRTGAQLHDGFIETETYRFKEQEERDFFQVLGFFREVQWTKRTMKMCFPAIVPILEM